MFDLTLVIVIGRGFLPLMQAPSPTLSLESIFTSTPFLLALGMKFTFEIKTEPVIQAAIIVAGIAFSADSLAPIANYATNLIVSTFCAVTLAFIVYLALRFLPY